ncbi:chromosomal replication initiator protein DnaA [Elusimicrobiota bacterium]
MEQLFDNPENIWQKIKNDLKDDFPQESFNLWFNPTKASSFNDNVLIIDVPNKYFSDWMNRNKGKMHVSLVNLIGNNDCTIEFNIQSNLNAYIPPAKKDIQDPTFHPEDELIFHDTVLNPRYTFESFIVGSSNQFAQAVSEAVATEPGSQYNPLFIYGGVGLGKTHLLHAIGHRSKSINVKQRILYVTCEKFMQEMIEGLMKKTMPAFHKKYTNLSILLIDDIQFLENKERTQETFFHIFNTLYESQKQIVITSDNPPNKIKTLEDRLCSRFEWGVIADIQPPDLETRIAILKSKAERENIDVPYDVLLYIATNIKDNIRKLEGALIRIYAFSSLTGSAVTVDNVKEILKDIIIESSKLEPVSIDKIIEVVANHYHTQIRDLKSSKRLKTIVFPRHLAMYLSRKLTENSTTEIGKNFGNRDHTTVMYACKMVVNKLEDEPLLQTTIDNIINEIKAKNI